MSQLPANHRFPCIDGKVHNYDENGELVTVY